jgi:hypothetical protein
MLTLPSEQICGFPMSQGHRVPDIEAVLGEIEAQIPHSMPANELVRIRDLFDDATFLSELKRLLVRLDNNPNEMVAVLNRLTRIMREAERMRDKRESERGLVGQMAVGGGTGLIIGGVVALLNPAIGFLALIAVGGGAVMGGAAWIGARRLDDERSAYKQIAERLSAILKVVEL